MPTPAPRPNALHRLIQRLAATAPASWILARTLHLLDRPLLRWSSGRWSAAGLLTGLPTLMITTTGARTGRQRTTALVGLVDRERVVLVASYFGSRHHPAWYHNLRRHPEAQVSFNGRSRSYVAREADGAEYESYWRQAVDLYPGYSAYRQRASARHIPVLVLTPRAD